MKRAAAALRFLASAVARVVGLEGVFLLVGTALVSVGAGLIHPAGPWIVPGAVCFLAGIALTVPRKET